jgi:glucosamine--fructose-6-phosphate aminotransferase (isomerizing)
MCGIFGIVSSKQENIYQLVINGLIQLQNRGYDSAGICCITDGKFDIHKYASTQIINAIDILVNLNLTHKKDTYIGFGHNRWATHGVKNDTNSHPHISNMEQFTIVHNGIIENYRELKEFLIKNEFYFYSQTDTEVIVNLIEYNYSITKNILEAISSTINSLQGTYGIIIQCIHDPNTLYCVRNGSPLLVGQNEDQAIITSEQSGFCCLVNNYITLHNDDICIISRSHKNGAITIKTNQKYFKKTVVFLSDDLTPQPFKHWTIKEIYEQPRVVLNALNKGGRIKNDSSVKLGGLEICLEYLKNIDNVILLGCGTSYYAGLYGAHFFKNICNFNSVQTFDGAEFNECDIPRNGSSVFILISQSGETKDLYRCIEIARGNNITTIGIINVVDSLIAREVDCGIYCNAGKEVGVASTKAFTSQVVCLSMAAIWFAEQQKNINLKKRIKMIGDLNNLSNDITSALESCNEKIQKISNTLLNNTSNIFLLGKGSDEFIAKEGSLKIKEIAYIHAEGYSSSSLKHGPFALLDENFPVILFNLDQTHRTKTINCYQEVTSRNAPVIIITNDSTIIEDVSPDTNVIVVPANKTYSSLIGIVAIQLLAYYLSINKGLDPDRPKNLAKVVTVE